MRSKLCDHPPAGVGRLSVRLLRSSRSRSYTIKTGINPNPSLSMHPSPVTSWAFAPYAFHYVPKLNPVPSLCCFWPGFRHKHSPPLPFHHSCAFVSYCFIVTAVSPPSLGCGSKSESMYGFYSATACFTLWLISF